MTSRSARPNRYQPFRNLTSWKIWITETVTHRKFLVAGILSLCKKLKTLFFFVFWILTCGLNNGHFKFWEFGQNGHFLSAFCLFLLILVPLYRVVVEFPSDIVEFCSPFVDFQSCFDLVYWVLSIFVNCLLDLVEFGWWAFHFVVAWLFCLF